MNIHCISGVMRKIQNVAGMRGLLSSIAEGIGARSGGYVNESIAMSAILHEALVVSCVFRFYNFENVFYVASAFRNINCAHFFLSVSVCIKLYNCLAKKSRYFDEYVSESIKVVIFRIYKED